ncbi:MAG TPA: phospholipid carrier-dependent glycosyltransferase [Anaerolineales bacterium]|nr:phospholipid carrier-dependent glycosyltransferase [Anaerolineales bacterium]
MAAPSRAAFSEPERIVAPVEDQMNRWPGHTSYLIQYEKIIPFVLSLLFIGITTPGISWGTPEVWNPDELVIRVDEALHGGWEFDTTNFDYPSLPKYAMYAVGKVVYGLGYSRSAFIQSARFITVLLGGAIVLLIYWITRMSGGGIYTAMLASFLTISSSEIARNTRFAHNDLYLAFFVVLTVYWLIKYNHSKNRLWLYCAFFGVGLAASSKYNGASIIIAPLVLYLASQWGQLTKRFLRILERLFIGLALSVLGYGIGTPRAILWAAFYIKRVVPALTQHANYEIEPESKVGFLGQWSTLNKSLSTPIYVLFLISFTWFAFRVIWPYIRKGNIKTGSGCIKIILLTIIAFDLPILLSYNFPSRFFIPLIPLFSILSALFIQDILAQPRIRSLKYTAPTIVASLIAILCFTFLRAASIFLLFENDARIPASEFVKALPAGTSIEYTLYPPNIPENQFSSKHNYPIFFKKFPEQSPPQSKLYEFNQGEPGIESRRPDYLIIDSFTFDRFSEEYECTMLPVECAFFRRLQSGQTDYQLIKTFSYSLPAYLPLIKVSFLNPEIQIYQRIP